MDNIVKFEYYKSKKESCSVSPNKKNEKICKRLKRYC